jgi:hypothetical protein
VGNLGIYCLLGEEERKRASLYIYGEFKSIHDSRRRRSCLGGEDVWLDLGRIAP